ncbi:MAG: type 1 glutamine amidotransferase [Chromatiales bacterium]|jgi:GMP synthase-like glutamine amidotransferase
MKPIRIFRHIACEGPGYLGEFFDRQEIAWELVCIDVQRPVPMQVDDISGLVFMGASVGVNDPLPWVEQELRLIRNAHESGVPMMGICFGGQLISKALGGVVTRGEGMEIGWHPLYRLNMHQHQDWLDGLPVEFETFHWHADTFSMPPGSQPLLMSECYKNQGFVLGDILGMQFHLEMTEEMVEAWIERYGSDLQLESCCIQSAKSIKQDLAGRIMRLHQISDVIYGNWLARVRKCAKAA